MIQKFPIKEYLVYYLMDSSYITCFADVLIIGAILATYGSFAASHHLFEQKKNELIASGDLNIRSSINNVRTYLWLIVIANLFVVVLVIFLFWPVDILLLVLLSYNVFFK